MLRKTIDNRFTLVAVTKKKLKKNLFTLEDYIYTQNNTILAYQSVAQYHIQT